MGDVGDYWREYKEYIRKWHELTFPQQAGIRCAQADYIVFLCDAYPDVWKEIVGEPGFDTGLVGYDSTARGGTAAEMVRRICDVMSRSELSELDDACKWPGLEAEYQRWLTDQQYADHMERG